jgi:protein SCO1/2
MNSPQRRRLLTLAGLAAVMLIAGLVVSMPPAASWLHHFGRQPRNGQDLGKPGWPAAFDLKDAKDRERTPADLRGRVGLVTFGYTHCPDTCPATLARLAAVMRLIGRDADKVQVVFITIDPERDDALLLGNYVGAFDASFWALRGDALRTEAAARAFHAEFNVAREGAEIRVEHTVDVFLVDPHGAIREILPPYLTATQVADDVRAALRE